MIWALWLSKPLRYAVIGLMAMAGYEAWKIHQRNIGARVAIEKVEKANETAIAIGNAGASKSGIAGVSGQRDPTTRND